jgi:hypothetical protein
MANEYLQRTPTSSGNRKVFTISAWTKINEANNANILGNSHASGSTFLTIRVATDGNTNSVLVYTIKSGTDYSRYWNLADRDHSSWIHHIFAFDTTAENVDDRVIYYRNGAKVTSYSDVYGSIPLDYEFDIVTSRSFDIFKNSDQSTYGKGQIFDYFFVDGQQLTPDVFGFYKDGDGYQSSGTSNATDFRPGQWSPRAPKSIKYTINRSGGFGVNGFYLPMNDSSNPGADFHCDPNSIITLKGEDLPQPRNGAPTTSDAFVSELRQETGTLGFDGCIKVDSYGGLVVSDHSDLDLGTGDYTIEGFYYIDDSNVSSGYHALFDFRGTSGANGTYPAMFRHPNGHIYFYLDSVVRIDNVGFPTNKWTHVALSRSSGTTRLFVDGVEGGSFSDTISYLCRELKIGHSATQSNPMRGFISNFRVVKGTALYTSNFTKPTQPLENINNTIVLMAQSETSSTAGVAPATIATYTYNSNSVVFATRNELTGSTVLAVPGISTSPNAELVTNGTFDTDVSGWTITVGSAPASSISWVGGSIQVTRGTGAGAGQAAYQAVTVEVGKSYVASLLCRGTVSGTTTPYLFVGTTAGANDVLSAFEGQDYQGRIAGTFTATGTTVYVAAVLNNYATVLFDNISIREVEVPIDYSADIKGSGTNKTLTANGNAGVGYEIPGYYGSAMTFDGTGDHFRTTSNLTDFQFGTGDFTVEAWIFKSAQGSYNYDGVISLGGQGSATDGWFIEASDTRGILFACNGDTVSSPNTLDVNNSQWSHIVAERYNGVTTLYYNGVAIATNTNIGSVPTNGTYLDIGGYGLDGVAGTGEYYFNGKIQDVRVYKGVAKYKGGFDVPKPYTPVGIESWRTTTDTCKNNFCTMNVLNHNNGTFANGNLTTSEPAANGAQIYATMGSNTGKWYYEAHVEDVGTPNTGGTLIGINPLIRPSSNIQNRTAYRSEGSMYNDSGTDSGSSAYAYVAGDTIGVAWDTDNKRLWFAKNGTWLGSGDPAGNSNPNVNYTNTETQGPFIAYDNGTGAQVTHLNFGQNPSFSGQVTAGTNADDSGKGLFKYAPPSGFLALCEDNLPAPAIADPGDYMRTVLYTGDGNYGRSITGVGFQPDFVWTKERSSTSGHFLLDSVRGVTNYLSSHSTAAEGSSTNTIISFDSSGYSIGASGAFNESNQTYVAWCWKAGGAAVSNTDGSITSVVSVNQTAGFSIVSYTGTGANATVGHGLGVAPKMMIFKGRFASNWTVYHNSLPAPTTSILILNSTGAAVTSLPSYWNSTVPTSTVFSLSTDANVNSTNAAGMIAYCWTEIEGFSRFGSYVANNSTDGPFVYCGFKPAWVLVKNTTTTGTNWELIDNVRSSSNGNNAYLIPNDSAQEYSTEAMDFLSNGFKLRTTSSGWNSPSGDTYIFAAFAESPFQTANAK